MELVRIRLQTVAIAKKSEAFMFLITCFVLVVKDKPCVSCYNFVLNNQSSPIFKTH